MGTGYNVMPQEIGGGGKWAPKEKKEEERRKGGRMRADVRMKKDK